MKKHDRNLSTCVVIDKSCFLRKGVNIHRAFIVKTGAATPVRLSFKPCTLTNIPNSGSLSLASHQYTCALLRRRHAKRKKEDRGMTNLSLLLGAEHGLADVRASKAHVGGLLELEHGVHGREVGAGALKVCDDLDIDVGF